MTMNEPSPALSPFRGSSSAEAPSLQQRALPHSLWGSPGLVLGGEVFINPTGLSPPTLWARSQAGTGSWRAPRANLPWQRGAGMPGSHHPGLLLPWPRSEYPDRRAGHAPSQLMLRTAHPGPRLHQTPEQGHEPPRCGHGVAARPRPEGV